MKWLRAVATATVMALGVLAYSGPADAGAAAAAKSAVDAIAPEATQGKAEQVHYRYRRYYSPRVYYYTAPRYYYRPSYSYGYSYGHRRW